MSDAPRPRLDEAEEVREEERFDPERIRPWLLRAFPGADGPVAARQFRRGHSNLTYLVSIGDREAVLRRAPFGAKVKSAHDMNREWTLLTSLRGVYPLAPRPLAFCDDESVLGARFYLMERVRGVILRGDGRGSGLDLRPELLRATSTALVDGLADLHAVRVEGTPLAALGRPAGYAERQVKGWTERYLAARTDDVPQIEAAAAWAVAHLPVQGGAALVHNDFKYDNVVLDPADPSRLVAVLDWEMATVGDPLMDLGTTLAYWTEPADPVPLRAAAFGPTHLPGSLTRREVAERYAVRSGRDPGDLLFHYVFALFKLAVIVQQIYRRFVDGHTSDPRFARLGDMVRVLGVQVSRALERGRIHDLG
ncbi:MAG TPA: phosphotransferase family protein [Anaeromyxobacteraceae bacterium]|nr:phosphotransferase family protein [Anaeromyxobacteraceae bacterium]